MVSFLRSSSFLTILVLMFTALSDARAEFNTTATLVVRIANAHVKKSTGFAKVSAMIESKRLAEGIWGGQQMRLSVTEKGAEVEFGCAHGTVDQRIEIDDEGRFDVRGTYEDESGGPVKKAANGALVQSTRMKASGDNVQAVRYTGRVTTEKMTVTVTITKTDRVIGTFTLIQGATPRLHKCH